MNLLAALALSLVTFASFPPTSPVSPVSISRINLFALPPKGASSLGLTQWERTERVLGYLEKAGQKETDLWLRDDYRIAWITTKWAREGVPEWAWHADRGAYAAATYQVLHCLPDEVWPRIVAQRHAKLGSLYASIWGEEISSPRKPVQSVRTAKSVSLKNRSA